MATNSMIRCWTTAALIVAGTGVACAFGSRPDDPLPETVAIHVQNANAQPLTGIRVAVWTRAMTSKEETLLGVTDAAGNATVVIPGAFVAPVAYAITPGDEEAIPRGWARMWREHYLPGATKILLSDPGTENAVQIASRQTITLDCPAANGQGHPRRGTGNAVVGSILSGDSVSENGRLVAHGIPKNEACALIIEEGPASVWMDLTAAQVSQDGEGPSIPAIDHAAGESVRVHLDNMNGAKLPPLWSMSSEVNFIKNDGAICYSYGVKANGDVKGAWSRDESRYASSIQLPLGTYFVVPGGRVSADIPAQRTWKAIRNGHTAELATAGLPTITVTSSVPGQNPPLFTVDARVAIDKVLEHVGLAD